MMITGCLGRTLQEKCFDPRLSAGRWQPTLPAGMMGSSRPLPRGQPMTLHLRSRTALLCMAALLSFAAHAIEPSATVKVTPLLKTTQSWNGAPIAYPEGQAEISALMIEI